MMITCKTCGSGHAAIFSETDQGLDCAATLFERDGETFVAAAYGSRFDMHLYKLKAGNYTRGTICDDCIQQLINDGAATLLNESYW